MPKGIYKRKPISKETRRKMSIARQGEKHPMYGKRHSAETRTKISESQKGRILTEETKERMSQAHKGRKPKNLDDLHQKNRGSNHKFWKGNKAGMGSIHDFVRRHKGKPERCEDCGITAQETKIEWSNKDHKYRRVLSDWNARCCKCHKRYDTENNGYFNTGVFKKGHKMPQEVRRKISQRMKQVRAERGEDWYS